MKKSLWLLFPILLITFSQVLAQNTRSAKKYLRHGLARFAKGDIEGAIGDYNRALEADPKFAEAYVNRGKARQIKKDLDGAIADYEAALINNSALVNESREIAQAPLIPAMDLHRRAPAHRAGRCSRWRPRNGHEHIATVLDALDDQTIRQ